MVKTFFLLPSSLVYSSISKSWAFSLVTVNYEGMSASIGLYSSVIYLFLSLLGILSKVSVMFSSSL